MKIINIQLCVSDSFAGLHQLLDGAAERKIIYAWERAGDCDGKPASNAVATIADGTAVAEAPKPKRKWTRRTPVSHADVQKSGTVTTHEAKDGTTVEVRK